jgi:hypothetical protein
VRSVPYPNRAQLVAAAGCLAATAAGLTAAARQAPKAGPTPTASAAKQTRPWKFRFATLELNQSTGVGVVEDGTATSDEGASVTCDHFTWNDKTNLAHGEGHLSVSDTEVDATADKADIDYQKSRKVMVLTGSVVVTLKPREKARDAQVADGKSPGPPTKAEDDDESLGASKRYAVTVTCPRLEYHYSKKRKYAVLTGPIVATQKVSDHTRILRAPRAEWFGLEERALLAGPVEVEDTKGRKGSTPEAVTLFTTEGAERLVLRKGTWEMPVEEDDDQPATQKPPAKPADGQPGGAKPAEGRRP